MISFHAENNFVLDSKEDVREWISLVIDTRGFAEGEVSYVFCDDAFLLELNKKYLDHDTLTDIISFDYSLGSELHGEIYISTERVEENAATYEVSFVDELHRVLIHGILHYMGLKDKSETEEKAMRRAEDEALAMRSFV